MKPFIIVAERHNGNPGDGSLLNNGAGNSAYLSGL
jgi:hypothetical protein